MVGAWGILTSLTHMPHKPCFWYRTIEPDRRNWPCRHLGPRLQNGGNPTAHEHHDAAILGLLYRVKSAFARDKDQPLSRAKHGVCQNSSESPALRLSCPSTNIGRYIDVHSAQYFTCRDDLDPEDVRGCQYSHLACPTNDFSMMDSSTSAAVTGIGNNLELTNGDYCSHFSESLPVTHASHPVEFAVQAPWDGGLTIKQNGML